jgi:hypothetical protein
MPQLGLGIEIGRVSGGAYDSDALAYFARAGIASGTQTPSSYDNAASFNGTNQFLSIPSNSTLQVGGQAFSFSVWFNVSNVSGTKYLIGKSAFSFLEYGLCVNGAAIQMLLGNNSSGWVIVAQSATPVTANTWNHAVFTYNGTTATIYLNGASVGNASGSITTSGTGEFGIGTSPNYGQNWAGSISSVGFWKRALTASEVTALWNNGAGRTYASLDSGLRTNLISWWALNQNSVTADSHGTNTLTNNGSVTAPNIGPIITGYSDSRRLISDFVRGIKSLGLWNSMVCWPLRASQNASTTLTARSLGGLGTFDAALANFTNAATAWGSNGVITNGTTNLITSQLNYNLRQGSIFLYVQPTNSSNANYTSYGGGSSAGNGNFSLHVSSTGGTGLGVTQPNLNLANSSTANGLGFYGVAYSGGATSFSAWTIGGNNSSVSGAWGNTTGTPTILNLAYSSIPTEAVFGLMSLTMPVAVSFNAPLTQAQHIQLCLLYRSTIGLGL